MGSVSGSVHLRRRQVASLCPFLRLSPSLSLFLLRFLSRFPGKKASAEGGERGEAERLRGWLSTKNVSAKKPFFVSTNRFYPTPAGLRILRFLDPVSNPRIFLFHRPRSETSYKDNSFRIRVSGGQGTRSFIGKTSPSPPRHFEPARFSTAN